MTTSQVSTHITDPGSVDAAIESGSYRQSYKHRTGHWRGLDVHDAGDYRVDGEYRVLEPGMVVTVEPGELLCRVGRPVTYWFGVARKVVS